MDVLHFACPHCGARLRVRDPLSVGRQAHCPDCRRGIVIVAHNGAWRIDATPEPSAAASAPAGAPAQSTPAARHALWSDPRLRVRIVTAGAGLILLAFWLTVIGWPRRSELAATASRPDTISDADAARGVVAQLDDPSVDDEPPDAAGTMIPHVPPSDPPNGELSNKGGDLVERQVADAGPAAPEESDADDQPLLAEFAPDPAEAPRPIDIQASLRQPIASYELPQPRLVSELLPELAELVGAPIRPAPDADESVAARLKASVRVRLHDTTVGDILTALLKPAGLAYEVEQGEVRLRPR